MYPPPPGPKAERDLANRQQTAPPDRRRSVLRGVIVADPAPGSAGHAPPASGGGNLRFLGGLVLLGGNFSIGFDGSFGFGRCLGGGGFGRDRRFIDLTRDNDRHLGP